MRALLTLLLLALAPLTAAADERILSFADEVRVAPDASVTVTEDIAVRVEGREIRHGIVRDFPTRYPDRNGRQASVGFEVLSVQLDGRDETYKLESLSNGTRVRIGRAEATVPKGVRRYRLTYRTTRQIGYFAGFDELYWNVNGTGWTFPIDLITATVLLPPGATILQRSFYTGAQGEQGKDARVVEERPGRIVFRTTQPLAPGENLTVAVAWPKGIVAPPSEGRRIFWALTDNAAPIAGAAGSVLVLAYFLVAWAKVGRDPRGGTIIPIFTPPEGLSAPAVRYAREMTLDDKGFAAGILTLAVKRRLRIADLRRGYRLERQDADQPPLTPAEGSLRDAIFPDGEAALDLERVNHARISDARKALKAALAREIEGEVFHANLLWFVPGTALAVLTLGLVFLLLRDQFANEDMANFALFAGGGAGILLVVVLDGLRGWWRDRRLRTFLSLVVRLVVFATIAGFAVVLLAWTGSFQILTIALLALVLAGIAYTFLHLLKAPTPEGRVLLDRIEGFRRYLEVAEEHRLGVLHPPERTPELFERYLPYALALGVEHSWSRKFAGVLAAAGADGNPSWYSGDRWDPDRPSRFADHVGSSLATAAASAASAPGSSSGSGGGGSSGGGGGGGGGSGW